MAGNYLKYGAAEASFGSKNAGDLPVDAHSLIALCAPRPTFISYGIPERGDAKWLDRLIPRARYRIFLREKRQPDQEKDQQPALPSAAVR